MHPFTRMCRIEALKLRRTLALWMVVLAPAVVVTLQMLLWSGSRSTFDVDIDLWLMFQKNILSMWGIFMQPLFVALVVALVYHADHASQGWLRMFALPVPRWTVPAAKLVVVVSLSTAAAVVLFGATLAGTVAAARVNERIVLQAEIPWAAMADRAGRVFLASLVIVAIQNAVSLRWSSITVSLGVGITGTFLALFASSWEYGPYYPWLMPLISLHGKPEVVARLLWLSPAVAVLVIAVTLAYGARRDPARY